MFVLAGLRISFHQCSIRFRAMDGPELLHWLEERLKEEREILERQHVLVLAQMQSMLPKRLGIRRRDIRDPRDSKGLYKFDHVEVS